MKIQKIDINFGKKPVALCRVKTAQDKEKRAVIYNYNPRDLKDRKEIEDSCENSS